MPSPKGTIPKHRSLHALTQLNIDLRTARCALCGDVDIRQHTRNGKLLWVCGRKAAGSSPGRGGSEMRHVLTFIDADQKIGTCTKCGPVRIYPAEGAYAREKGDDWTCARRPPERRVGGHTRHQVTVLNEAERLGNCVVCGAVNLIWRPFLKGGGRWGCERTRDSIGAMATVHSVDFVPALCPFCELPHTWHKQQGKRCKARLLDLQNGEINSVPNACALCKKVPDDTLHLDHDHKTGAVRGLLCNSCNRGLGYFKDDPLLIAAASLYLQEGGHSRKWLHLIASDQEQ